ncbi:hypothetical protein DVA44_14810 [Leclercia sp. W17]|nr:hypothetical protein DVA44_14810 [Leclercia sp. W17]
MAAAPYPAYGCDFVGPVSEAPPGVVTDDVVGRANAVPPGNPQTTQSSKNQYPLFTSAAIIARNDGSSSASPK